MLIPHTIVLAPGLEIVKIYTATAYWGRPSTEGLRQDLREITRRILPDWDLSAPGLREKWDAGERDALFPYGRSLRDVFAEQDVPAGERERLEARS
ncbi:MAG: hypothetical protein WD830_05265 [Chloroflexota bacterium]